INSQGQPSPAGIKELGMRPTTISVSANLAKTGVQTLPPHDRLLPASGQAFLLSPHMFQGNRSLVDSAPNIPKSI
ncbi:MAG: hypothetical protein JSV81_05245, partial [Anaerolineales bacterium]